MTDEQCNAIVDAIKGLTMAVREVAENVDGIYSYHDTDLCKEVRLVAQILEEGLMK